MLIPVTARKLLTSLEWHTWPQRKNKHSKAVSKMTSGWKRLIMIVWNDQSAKFLLEERFISHPSSLCKQDSHLPQKKLIEADNMMTCFFTFDAIMNMNKTVMYMKGLYRAWVCHAMAMNDYLLPFCRHNKGRQVRGHLRRLLEATSELLKPLTAYRRVAVRQTSNKRLSLLLYNTYLHATLEFRSFHHVKYLLLPTTSPRTCYEHSQSNHRLLFSL